MCKDAVGQLAEMCDGCMPLMTDQVLPVVTMDYMTVMLLANASNPHVAQIKQMNAVYLTIQMLAATD